MSIERFVSATENAIDQKNWYAAIVLALTLPDICARLQHPEGRSGQRYETWWNSFMQHHYQRVMFGETVIFMGAGDAYALRCAVLHEGRDEISEQRAKETLERFHIVSPPPGGTIHCNSDGVQLQLQVDIFCRQICDAVRSWKAAVAEDADVIRREAELIEIGPNYTF